MDLLASLDRLVADHLASILILGQLRYAQSPPGRPKSTRALSILNDRGEYQLLLWDSGEADLTYGARGQATSVTVSVFSPEELEALFARWLSLASSR